MAENPPSAREQSEPTGDPVTIIGLIYRLLDRPHRTAALVAVLSLLLSAAVELAHAPVLAGLNPGVWGVVISGASTAVALFRSGRQKLARLREWIARKTQGRTHRKARAAR